MEMFCLGKSGYIDQEILIENSNFTPGQNAMFNYFIS